ncbi:MAG: ABC transporter permease subunit [Calditrichia bacterium]|nr:ABC transporter permease subunit [Calditrichia bacterium]
MKKTYAVFQKEIKHFFYSPIAYIVIAAFTLIAGIFFYLYLSSFVEAAFMDMVRSQQFRTPPQKFNINLQLIRPYFWNLALISIFVLPLVTMRLYSEEKRSGTIELLYTTPLSVSNIVLGKFFAGIVFYSVMLVPSFIYMVILFIYGDPELGPVLSGYLGLFLLGSAFISAGLFISSLTENQIIAAIGGFGLSLLLWVIGWAANYSGPGLAVVLNYLSIINHFEDFAQGVIDTRHLFYYLLFCTFGVYLTFKSVESIKWRS